MTQRPLEQAAAYLYSIAILKNFGKKRFGLVVQLFTHQDMVVMLDHLDPIRERFFQEERMLTDLTEIHHPCPGYGFIF